MKEVQYFAIGLLVGLLFFLLSIASRAKPYIPEHWHQWVTFVVMLAGLYIGQNLKPPTYDVVLGVVCIFVFALMIALYQVRAGLMYQAYLTGWGQPKEKRPEPDRQNQAPDLGPGFIPTKRAVMLPNPQVVAVPKISPERKVARALIDQRNHNMKVDLTEDFWLKNRNFDGSREEFVEMKARWRRNDVIYKTGSRKNAPDDVKDWKKVRWVADGNLLPS
jgi:hypothetical protein